MLKEMINKERILVGLQWFILFALFAYDGFSYLPQSSNFALFKSIYYILIFVAFLFVIALQSHKGIIPYQQIGRISWIVQLYVWLYFARLFYDFMIANVEQEIVTNPFAAVFLYANAAIIPFYGLRFFRWDLIDTQRLNLGLLLIFLTMGVVSLNYIFTGKALEYLGSDGRFMGNESMDTIAFGHLGTSITILAITLWHQDDIRLWHKLLSIFAILAGLFISIAAGSRGAIVALIVCVLAYMYLQGHRRTLFIVIPILILVIYLTLPVVNDVLVQYNNHSMERLYNSLYNQEAMTGGVTSNRDILYQQAWEHFTDSPIIGYSFFIKGEYAHNSILESFIGLGIVGGVLFLIIITYALYAVKKLTMLDKRYMFICLLFIQYLCYSIFSRTLSMLPLFWLSMFLVIIYHSKEKSIA